MSIFIDDLEQENWKKYSGQCYHADKITILPSPESKIYTNVLLWIRIKLALNYSNHGTVLDLCCGTGEHLFYLASEIKKGKGLDFSKQFIEKANKARITTIINNIEFVEGNARRMPFEDKYFDLAYCFSSLYHIPKVEEVIDDMTRVLKQGGKCVVDLGNLYSLNTIVCNAYPELAHPYHIPVRKMKRYIQEAGLEIVEHRAFQILPMWADRPKWLKPLLWHGWVRILEKQIGEKMLDEWISNLPILKFFAFRHVFVCEKR